MPASITRFVNLLQEYGVGSKEAAEYRSTAAGDADFERRADVAEKLFKHRRWVMKALEPETTAMPLRKPKPATAVMREARAG